MKCLECLDSFPSAPCESLGNCAWKDEPTKLYSRYRVIKKCDVKTVTEG